MLKPILVGVALFSSALLAQAAAPMAANSEMTMAQVQTTLPTIRDSARRTALTKFFDECRNKHWLSCQLAWFDLHDAGLEEVYHVKSGLATWEFTKDTKSTATYRAIAIALSTPLYRDAWDLTLRPQYADVNIPTEVPARAGLNDESWHTFALDIVHQRFYYAGIAYDVNKAFVDQRAEWLRYLSLVFAARNDKTNSYAALEALQTYAKLNTVNSAVYNNTLAAVQKYLSTIGAK